MNSFYISCVGISGRKDTSMIELKPGVNIICGPSNTGKTYILECIDFLFGKRESDIDGFKGDYDTVFMYIKTSNDEAIRFSRKINSSKIIVNSECTYIQSKEYSSVEIRNVFMLLMGIHNKIKVIKNEKFDIQSLTWRSILHLFFIKEQEVIKKESLFNKDRFNVLSATLSSLIFLITGKGVDKKYIEELKKISDNTFKDKSIFITNTEKQLLEFKNEYENLNKQHVDNNLQDIKNVISITHNALVKNDREIEKISIKIYELEEELQKNLMYRDRFSVLRKQYISDRKRAELIIEGEKKFMGISRIAKCPFCDNRLPEHTYKSYQKIARLEIEDLDSKLVELVDVQQNISEKIKKLTEIIKKIREKKKILSEEISDKLEQTLLNYDEKILEYEILKKLENKIEVLEGIVSSHNEMLDVPETYSEKYVAKKHLPVDFQDRMEQILDSIIKECNYPEYNTVTFDYKTMDVSINDTPKNKMGKGYRAYINSIMALALNKYLRDYAIYRPELLIIDSPILSLKESNESVNDNMKYSLFKYIVSHIDRGQIIIVENEIPDIDYQEANIIRFTKDKNTGRYGFLNECFE